MEIKTGVWIMAASGLFTALSQMPADLVATMPAFVAEWHPWFVLLAFVFGSVGVPLFGYGMAAKVDKISAPAKQSPEKG